jgi:hypothetical protein
MTGPSPMRLMMVSGPRQREQTKGFASWTFLITSGPSYVCDRVCIRHRCRNLPAKSVALLLGDMMAMTEQEPERGGHWKKLHNA